MDALELVGLDDQLDVGLMRDRFERRSELARRNIDDSRLSSARL